jgi:hypothetical protein
MPLFHFDVTVKVHDWHDLEEVHNHVQESIHEMETARAANHYDMAGHGAKAEEDLRKAERELHEAIEAARGAGKSFPLLAISQYSSAVRRNFH